jgi:LmbE family N-acetylglucosaminyl deacetylase
MIAKLKRRAWNRWVRTVGRPAGQVLSEIEGLPVVDPGELLDAGPILVMAPHPDDESLGCGGLLAFAAQRGVPARIVFMTDGSGSHPGSMRYQPERLRDLREQEAIDAAEVLGFSSEALVFLRQSDGALAGSGPEADALVARVTEEGRRIGAASIFSTWIFDDHPDHVASAMLARRVARNLGARLYHYPIWGLGLDSNSRLATFTRPTGCRIDVSEVIELKKQAIASHVSQMTDLIADSITVAPGSEVFAAFGQPFERYVKG